MGDSITAARVIEAAEKPFIRNEVPELPAIRPFEYVAPELIVFAGLAFAVIWYALLPKQASAGKGKTKLQNMSSKEIQALSREEKEALKRQLMTKIHSVGNGHM